MYIRTTYDQYEIQGNYGQGWEAVCAESTRKEARARLKEYNENEPQYPHRIVKRRIKKEAQNA
jgi:hypothetical protein